MGELVQSVGVFRFKQDSSSIGTTVYPDSLQVSPVTPRSLVVVVSYDKRFLYVSREYGRTWTRYQTPSMNFDPAEEFHLSNSNPLHMVILDRDGMVSVTVHCHHVCEFMLLCLIFSSMRRTMEALIGTLSLGTFSSWNCKTIVQYMMYYDILLIFTTPPPSKVETNLLAALVILCTTAQRLRPRATIPSIAWTCTPSRRSSSTAEHIVSGSTANISLSQGRM